MSSSHDWGKGPIIKKSAPTLKLPEIRTETRSGTQKREFTTLTATSSQRSTSVSRRHESRTFTYDPVTNRASNTQPWVHTGDTGRVHTHPGGTPHTPTSAVIGGTTTTPLERLQLDALPSTTHKSSTVWD